MSPVFVVIADIVGEDSFEWRSSQSDEMVKQVTPQEATQPLGTPFCHGLLQEVERKTIFMDRMAADTSNPYFPS